MEKKIKELKERFRTANKKAMAEIDKEMEALSKKNNTAFSKAMLKSVKETAKHVEDLVLAEKLKEVLPAISVSYIANHYFRKTPQWFYQRLNGNTINGKPARFTDNELKTLSGALKDVGNKIVHSASCIL
jgi:hypothetical protein